MRSLVLLGVLVTICALLWAFKLEHIDLNKLWHGTAFLIVVVCSFGVTLLQSSPQAVKSAALMIQWLLSPPDRDFQKAKKNLLTLHRTVRADGANAATGWFKKQRQPWIEVSVRQAMSTSSPEQFLASSRVALTRRIKQLHLGADFFEEWGGYTPTLGIFGAVIGLIQVMRSIDDPAALGDGIATAFVATLYGIGAANLVLLPLANKCRALIGEFELFREYQLIAIAAFAEGLSEQQMVDRMREYEP